jgi:hypothetical protein
MVLGNLAFMSVSQGGTGSCRCSSVAGLIEQDDVSSTGIRTAIALGMSRQTSPLHSIFLWRARLGSFHQRATRRRAQVSQTSSHQPQPIGQAEVHTNTGANPRQSLTPVSIGQHVQYHTDGHSRLPTQPPSHWASVEFNTCTLQELGKATAFV